MATHSHPSHQRALGWLLYVLAVLLIVGPLSEWMVIVWPLHPAAAQWRFGSIGLLGDRLTVPMVGLFTAILSATLLEHRAVQGTLGGLSLLAAPALAGLAAMIALDGLQLRYTVRADVLPGFDRSLVRTVLLLFYAAVVAAVIGWAALKVRTRTGSSPSGPTPRAGSGRFGPGGTDQ